MCKAPNKPRKSRVLAPAFIVIDLFCGGGGTTTGFERTGGRVKVIAAINHDKLAIKSHWENHKHVKHFEEDIRTLDLTKLVDYVNRMRLKYPGAKVILWASLECTNFSNAKGGKPREADSRTLAYTLLKKWRPVPGKEEGEYYDGPSYIQLLDPDYIQIENVVEFLAWGPLDENGKPLSRRRGRDWLRWCADVNALGYRDEWREVNAADMGAYTSRNRLFGMFAKPGLPLVWPQPTHSKKAGKVSSDMFDSLKPWMPVREVLDLHDEGQSIFGRENNPALRKQDRKPLVVATEKRILAGLIKEVAGGKDAWMVKYNSMNKNGTHVPPSLDEPCPAVTTQNRLYVASVAYLSKQYSGGDWDKNISIEGPAHTITTVDHHALVQAQFLLQNNFGNTPAGIDQPARTLTTNGGNLNIASATAAPFLSVVYKTGYNRSIEEPAPTLKTKDNIMKVHPVEGQPVSFIDMQYGTACPHSVDQPTGALTGNPKQCLIQTYPFIARYFGDGGQTASVNDPNGALMPIPKERLVVAEGFVMPTNFNNKPTSLNDPIGTITANRKWHYLVNPAWFGGTRGVDNPSPTLVARADKAPLYLYNAEEGDVEAGIVVVAQGIPLYFIERETGNRVVLMLEGETATMREIKTFMAMYGLVDIKMRMLKIVELLRIQGFPADYKLVGSQTHQKKFIGNSVVPHVVTAWALALADAILKLL
jgi:DNA (cytosine-5)-methyltransferase 1